MKTLILFVLLIGLSVTASAQLSTPADTCICYNDAQDIRCLECLLNYPVLSEKLELSGEIITERTVELTIAGELIQKQFAQITQLQSDLAKETKKKKLFKTICGGLLAIIGIETIILVAS